MGATVFNKVLMLILNIVLARYLGVSIYGTLSLSLVIISFLKVINVAGLNQGIKKYIPLYFENNKSEANNLLIGSMVYIIATGILLIILNFFFGKYGIFFLKNENIYLAISILILSLPFYGISKIVNSYLLAIKKAKVSYLLNNALYPSILLFFVFCVLNLKSSLITVSLAFLAAAVVTFGFSLFFLFKYKILQITKVNKILPPFSFLKFSLTLGLMGMLSLFLIRIDIIMVGYFLSSKDVGFYKAAFTIAVLVSFLLPIINNIFPPLISSLYTKSDLSSLSSLYKLTTRWVTTFGLFIYLLFLFIGKDLLKVFGANFVEAYDILLVLGLAQIVNISVGSAGFMLSMSGSQKKELLNVIIVIILNLFLNIILIKRYGVIGAAFATAIAITLVNLIRLIQVYMKFKIYPYSWESIRVVLVVLLTLLIFVFGRFVLGFESVLFNYLALLFSALAFLFFGIIPEDRDLFLDLVENIKK